MHGHSALLLAAAIIFLAPAAESRCACQGPPGAIEEMTQKAASAARRLPSEGDRQIAAGMRAKGLLDDAAQYYRSAAAKAEAEAAEAKTQPKSASEVEQVALHSAAIHREAASFFAHRGDAQSAAINWELAINNELAVHKINTGLATEYGTVARLYEQAGKLDKAAELYKKQADTLAAVHGRYDSGTQFALSEFSRVSRRAKASSQM